MLFERRESAHGPAIRGVVGFPFRHLDAAGGEEGPDAVLSGAPVDVTAVILRDVEARVAVTASSGSAWLKRFFQAAAWIDAVSVITPSMSKMTAS